ncbi:MAG: NAD(P)/FAD-dependent oxidoreductase [Rhodococcus sp. (in: high G+C Gram-positive bacteria)]|nr:MAG: NAD(P)/FAD-dependent oxidoreductase [Rhodococcus sp. (in: high G+C Gram-positive bacteria)]
MSLPVTDTSDRATSPRHVDTLIIGSGFAGLGAAIKLTKAGKKNFVVVERGHDVGGTWRDNTYPGAACDVPSHLYSYSFALNPEWTRSFSTQPEIQKYIAGVARKYGVMDKHVFGTDVTSARWNASTSRWDVETTTGNYTAKIVVSAVGALCEPNLPDIKGIHDFEGDVFHSAQWNHDVSLAGKRVAVIGTGASAIQIVPAIAGQVEHLDVYQRTAPWILPRADRPYTKLERFAFKHVPGFQRLARAGIYAMRETQVVGLAKNPAFMKPLQWASENHLRTQIKDKALRAKVTPNFRIGCKRMLISNAYYPALAQTFDDGGQQGYKGAAVANFPNMFFLVGPNTGLGHTSMVFMIESQINYLVDALNTIDKHDIGTIEVRKDVQDEYNVTLQDQLAKSVWMNGGCASWYLDKHGNNTTLWPGFTFEFRRQTKHFDLDAYRSVATADLTSASASTAAGNNTDKVSAR